MNRIKMSTNRKLIILGSSLLALLLLCSVALLIVSCQTPTKAYNTAEGEHLILCGRFEIASHTYWILYDPDTKIEYLASDAGITPLYDTWGRFKYYEEKPND